MTPIKIMIVEDEMITAESLKDMLEELGYEITGIHIRAEKALEAMEKEQPDFALLDINLKGEKTGIWLAQQLKDNHHIPYVFLTSYGDRITIEKATEVNPYGYLLKPIEKQNLFASIEVAIKKFSEIEHNNTQSEGVAMPDALFIKDEYLYIKIKYDDIQTIKANGNYIEIKTNEKKHLIKGTMDSFIQTLPESTFFRTHRSYAINIHLMEAFGGNFVKVGSEEIPLTPQNKEVLIQKLKLYQKT
ncbi:LytR/AlgR family response regulator transcription factor [Ekhidna sp.]|uniref:LytR/AlgR family response regulator transcription factor n=1 Tax=Ekhidna sp. TaxID=2608089 RepID=UPI003513CC21